MSTPTKLTTWIKIVVAALVGTPLAIAAVAPTASATNAPFVPQTRFAIDGNSAGPNDFEALYGPGLTPGGLPTTGVYYYNRNIDMGEPVEGCSPISGGQSDDTGGPTVKLSDGPVWASGGSEPNGKTDISHVDLAAEKVDVNGQINDILYVGYLKCGGNGTWQAMLYIDDGDGLLPTQGDLNGDYLFVFDFNPNTGLVSFLEYMKVAGAWTPQTINTTAVDGRASGDYGEAALNLTAIGIVDTSRSCQAVKVDSQAASITGGSLSSDVKDLVSVDPLTISGCGGIEVIKGSNPPGVSSSSLFTYRVRQQDALAVHGADLSVAGVTGSTPGTTTEPDADRSELDATISVGETDRWGNVVSQPDYLLEELALPSGWTLSTITCITTDLFDSDGDGNITELAAPITIYANGAPTGARFLVPPASLNDTVLPPALCKIVNSTSGLVIAKTGAGQPATFDFTVSGGSNVSVPLGGQSAVIPFTPGSTVTVTELAEAADLDWTLTSVDCDDPAGAVRAGNGITVTTVAGSVITCTFNNIQNGAIQIDKIGLPAASTVPFDFTINPGAIAVSDLTIAGAASSPVEVTPGSYTVTELEPPVDADWSLVDIICDGETAQNLVAQTATVTVASGQTVLCQFANNQRGPVTVTKTATLVGPVSGTVGDFDVRYTVEATSASYVTEQIDVVDALQFPATLTVVGAPSVSGDAAAAGWNGTTSTTLYDGAIAARDTMTWTIDVRVRLAPDAPAGDRDCDASGSGAWNHVDLAVDGVSVDDADACVELGTPQIDVTKNPPATVSVGAGGTMTAAYTIEVVNTGTGPGSYSLSDSFAGFPDWVTVTGATVVNTAPGSVAVNASLPAAGGAITTAPTGIGAGQTHTFSVTVSFTADPTATAAGATCDGTAENGLFNLASITSTSGPDSDDACVDIPRGRIVVQKATSAGTGTFSFTSNVPGALIDGGSITTTSADGVASGNTLSAYVTPSTAYSVGEDLTGAAVAGWTLEAIDCGQRIDQGDDPDGGSIVVNPAPGQMITCTFSNRIASMTYSKATDPAQPLTRNADGTWTIGYVLTVTNAAGAGPGSYNLADTLAVGTGVTVTSVDVVAAPAGVTPTATTSGVTADDVAIGEGLTVHTYRLVVDLTIDVVDGVSGDCQAPNGGISNSLTITGIGVSGEPVEVCDEFSTLTLVKQLVNDNGGNASIDDFTLTAVGSAATLTGTSPVASAVPAGSYALSEANIDGYAATAFDCGAAIVVDGDVTVPAGANVTCTIVNDDQPVDLQIIKGDGGFEAIAGGAPVPYTLTIDNVGTRDVDAGEPVTVTDVLPLGMTWVLPVPAGCTVADSTLTCSIPASSLEVADPPVVLSLLVVVAPDAASGVYVNRAWVTTQDDPACEGEDCQPLCAETFTPGQNVDCEPTPVDRQGAVEIVKTDDVADGSAVVAGNTYSYSLAVRNVGVSTLLPGLEVSDDLPAQLELVSVTGGAGWTCNTVDPVVCTYAPSLAPGASAPAITVIVRVANSATGTAIDNVATVVAAVDRDCLADVGEFVAAFDPACNQVTDSDDETTPLQANADLAIVKTASAETTAPGASFNWVLRISNNGPGTAFNVVVGDIVPSSLTITSVTSTQFTCGNAGNTVTCTRPSMLVGETGTVTVAVSVPANATGGSITNVGTVQASTPDPILTNNSDDATIVVVAQEPPTHLPPSLPPVTLPRTGGSLTVPMAAAAMALMAFGMIAVLGARRRRPAVAE